MKSATRMQVPLAMSIADGVAGRMSGEDLVNMFVEPAPPNARTPFILMPTPGLKAFSTIGGGTVRGNRTFDGVQYVVVGTQLYTVNSVGVETARGLIAGTARVDMEFDGFHVVIVADIKSYVYRVDSAVLSEITDGDLSTASSCTFMDQRILFSSKNTAEFQWADILNPLSLDGLNFATAETVPDKLLAVRQSGGDAVLFGAQSIEFWRSTGIDATSFVRSSASAVMEVGCISRDCVALLDNGFMWMGRDKNTNGLVIYRANGYAPQRISNHAIERFMKPLTDAELATAFAVAYQQDGHTFYALTVPGFCTFVYDTATQMWHRRVSGLWSQNQIPVGSWDAISPTLNGSKLIAGLSDGNLYEMTDTVHTERGNDIIREAILPSVNFGGMKFSISSFEVFMEMGVSQVAEPGYDAQILINYSDDGGKSWSNPRNAAIGVTGKYTKRAVIRQCGESRDRIWRIRVADNVPVKIVDAYMSYFPGTS